MSPSRPNSSSPLALDVTVLAGPNTGTRVRFDSSPAAFGRDATHPLIIDVPVVSRDHGYFDLKDGKWQIVNRSPNGLSVNGKRLKGRSSRVLPAEATVVIGDTPVMNVRLRDAAATQPGAAPDTGVDGNEASDNTDDADPLHKPRRKVTRTRLLVGLVLFWVVLFGVLFALEPMFNRNADDPRGLSLPVARLDDAALAQRVRQPAPSQPNDDRVAEQAMKQAESFYGLRDVKDDAAFRAMDAYRKAAAYSPGGQLADPLAQRRYLDLQQQLIDDLTRRYTDAMAKLESRRYEAAYRAFDAVLERYPDYDRGDRSIHRHAQKLRDFARRNIGD